MVAKDTFLGMVVWNPLEEAGGDGMISATKSLRLGSGLVVASVFGCRVVVPSLLVLSLFLFSFTFSPSLRAFLYVPDIEKIPTQTRFLARKSFGSKLEKR